MSDYRSVDGNNPFLGVLDGKNELLQLIKKKHPRCKNHYDLLKLKSGPLHKKFAAVYNERCGYCGISYQVRPFSDFEIDHFVCKSSGKEGVNLLQNLVYSCGYCNDRKHEFEIEESVAPFLSPDYKIGETFYRDEQMYIQIGDRFKNNIEIINFYHKLCFPDERRRIEFLLMSLISYKNSLQEGIMRSKINEVIDIIRNSYNRSY